MDRIMTKTKTKAVSLILVITMILTQFTGAGTVFAAEEQELPFTTRFTDSENQVFRTEFAEKTLTTVWGEELPAYRCIVHAGTETVKISKNDDKAVILNNDKKENIEDGDFSIKNKGEEHFLIIQVEQDNIKSYALYFEEDISEVQAAEVDKMILHIGTVSLESKSEIDEARAAYNRLPEDAKEKVKHLNVLEAAEEEYKRLSEEENKDILAAEKTDNLISSIGRVTLDSEEKIKAARESYEMLSQGAKKKVKKLKVLEEAESVYQKLKEKDIKDSEDAHALDVAILKIDDVTLASGPYIREVEEMYNQLSDEAVAKVKYLFILEEAEAEYDKIVRKADLDRGTVELKSMFFKVKGGYKITATGKHIHAVPIVKDSAGNLLKEGRDYTVKYSRESRINPGRYKITICGTGNYRGENSINLIITPKAPAGLKADLSTESGGYDDVVLSWKESSDNAGYNIYYKKKDDAEWKYYTRTADTSVVKKNLTDGTVYEFKVVPYYKYDGVRYCSVKYSTVSAITLKKVKKPYAAKYNSSRVRISWNNIAGESGYEVRAYNGEKATIFKTTGTALNIKVSKNRKYTFKVRAYKNVTKNGKTYRVYGT